HGSMLQYALLHLTGYDLPLAELKKFRQLHSKTPGHPERGITPGVETTTGPLGQGFANSVGLALAEKLLAGDFNRPGFDIVDHHTYVFMGDGCMMEGISHEAASIAGTWQLNKLIAVYDDNGISIDGNVRDWLTDDTCLRFRSYNWHVIGPIDGHDFDAVDRAFIEAKQQTKQPTLIVAKTIIGKGSPGRAGTEKAHGEALGEEEVKATRAALGWPHEPFVVPKDAYAAWDAKRAGAEREAKWNQLFDAYSERYPHEAGEFERRCKRELPAAYFAARDQALTAAAEKREAVSTRKASQLALEALAPALPEIVGGSADLTGSNYTKWSKAQPFRPDHLDGRHINYGVREFAMCAISSGLAAHGGFIAFAGTFLTFSDYARNALRMAALMKLPVIYVFTHDSIGLGEDVPTHQSIEHAASLRLIPNMDVWRPADTVESLVAWAAAIERDDGPSSLLFSRQSVPFVSGSADVALIRRGAYVIREADGDKPQAVLIATGSEVGLAIDAQKALAERKIFVRVVSMPSTTVFDRQEVKYKSYVLPAGVPRVAIEAGVTDYWWKYVRGAGAVIGTDSFGESAPAKDVFKYFNFTVDNVVATVKQVIAKNRKQ
ncbi:MAG: transketolase, partial [Burkholderiaceae bacterium]